MPKFQRNLTQIGTQTEIGENGIPVQVTYLVPQEENIRMETP